jgi:hypothetical protein
MGRFKRPLFRASHLGDKYPTVDLIIDILGRDDLTLSFFFAQIKATHQESSADARLPIQVSLERYNRLVRLPAPTYVIGVDELSETSSLIAARKTRQTPLSSMTKRFSLKDEPIKIQLHREVADYWKKYRTSLFRSQFEDV